jgi:hypothetical protein
MTSRSCWPSNDIVEAAWPCDGVYRYTINPPTIGREAISDPPGIFFWGLKCCIKIAI